MKKFFAIVAIFAASTAAHAVALTCSVNKRTDAHMCFAESELRENQNGIRTAALYMGGPNSMRKTNFFIAANCATRVLHLKDRDGVRFAGGGHFESTQTGRELFQDVCSSNAKKSK